MQKLSDMNKTYDTLFMTMTPSYNTINSQIIIELDCNEDTQFKDFSDVLLNKSIEYLDLAREYEFISTCDDKDFNFYARSDPNLLEYQNFEDSSYNTKTFNQSSAAESSAFPSSDDT